MSIYLWIFQIFMCLGFILYFCLIWSFIYTYEFY
jgi:hypothetical protein